MELKLHLFRQTISVHFLLKSRNVYSKALTPLCWKDRVGWQKWLTFVQKEFNMHNNDNVLEFAPDKINKAFKNYLHLCILLVWYYHRIFPPSLFKIFLMPKSFFILTKKFLLDSNNGKLRNKRLPPKLILLFLKIQVATTSKMLR